MKKTVTIILILLAACFVTAAFAAHGGDAKPVKKGILLAAFGTSEPQARAAFTNIENKVKQAFPDVAIRWAFTSHIIRNKLAGQGEILESPAQALANMASEGFTHVAVQSLHTIPGEEFEDLLQTVQAFSHLPEGFEKIAVGRPLLGAPADMERAASAVMATFPEKRGPEEALLLMGHGTPHHSDAFYAALMWRLQLADPNIYVGTVEGFPEISDILPLLRKKEIKKVRLAPFMSVAGDHARNDMAGPENDSWKSVLQAGNIQCEAVLKGTAEHDVFADIWVDHLRDAMKDL